MFAWDSSKSRQLISNASTSTAIRDKKTANSAHTISIPSSKDAQLVQLKKALYELEQELELSKLKYNQSIDLVGTEKLATEIIDAQVCKNNILT